MPYRVDEALCRGCAACVEACSQGAIAMQEDVAHILADLCIDCGACAEVCPAGAIQPAATPVTAGQGSGQWSVIPVTPVPPCGSAAS